MKTERELTHVHVEIYLLDLSADLYCERVDPEGRRRENERSVRILVSFEISSTSLLLLNPGRTDTHLLFQRLEETLDKVTSKTHGLRGIDRKRVGRVR